MPAQRTKRSQLSFRLILLVTMFVAAGCSGGDDDEDDPAGPTVALVAGDTVQSRISGTRAWLFTNEAATHQYALYLQSLAGTGTVTIEGPNGATSFALAPGLKLLEKGTGRITLGPGAMLHVRITGELTSRLFLYQVNPAPETVPPAYVLGNVLTETVHPSADIDEFTVTGSEGGEWLAYLESPAGHPELSLRVLAPSAGAALGGVDAADGAVLGDRAGVVGPLPVTGTYTIRVTSDLAPTSEPLAYHIKLLRRNRDPEVARKVYSPGDSILGESLDPVGDMDEFRIVGSPGQEVTIFGAYPTDSGPRALIFGTAGSAVEGTAQGLGWWHSGRMTIPDSGSVGFSVRPGYFDASSRSPYRAWIWPVRRAPEAHAAVLMLPDSVSTERIDPITDIDEFIVNIPESRRVNILFDAPQDAPLAFEMLAPEGSSPPVDPDQDVRVPLRAPGAWRLRVREGDFRDLTWTGPYRIRAYLINEGPESASPTFSIGEQVSETIDPLGDIDRFTFTAQRGQVLRFTSTIPGDGSESATVIVRNPSWVVMGSPFYIAYLGYTTFTAVAEVAETRTYDLVVDGGGGSPTGRSGPYTFRVEPAIMTPESNPATIGPGGVASESLESLDIDEYVAQAAPNSEIIVTSQHGPGGAPCIEILAPNSPDRLGYGFTAPYNVPSKPIKLGGDGRARIRLWALPSEQCFYPRDDQPRTVSGSPVPSYTMGVLQLNRAPEAAAGGLTVGGPAVTEAIDYLGDVDEFSFSAGAGQVVRLAISQPSPQPLRFEVEILSMGSDAVLATYSSIGWGTTEPFTVPASGSYKVRIFNQQGNVEGTGTYTLAVN